MKKSFFILLFIFLIVKTSYADYIATYYHTLIENSKILAFGKILSVQETTFKVLVLKSLKNCKETDTLLIKKFQNWTCASRYSIYEIDQEGIFFIDLTKDKKLKIMGAANEGEIIARKDTCFVKPYSQNHFPAKKFDFISKYEKFIPFRLETVMKGIKLYLENLDLVNAELKRKEAGTTAYQSESTKTYKNDFYNLVLEQKEFHFKK